MQGVNLDYHWSTGPCGWGRSCKKQHVGEGENQPLVCAVWKQTELFWGKEEELGPLLLGLDQNIEIGEGMSQKRLPQRLQINFQDAWWGWVGRGEAAGRQNVVVLWSGRGGSGVDGLVSHWEKTSVFSAPRADLAGRPQIKRTIILKQRYACPKTQK